MPTNLTVTVTTPVTFAAHFEVLELVGRVNSAQRKVRRGAHGIESRKGRYQLAAVSAVLGTAAEALQKDDIRDADLDAALGGLLNASAGLRRQAPRGSTVESREALMIALEQVTRVIAVLSAR